MSYIVVNDLADGTELTPTGVDYRYRTQITPSRSRLIRFFPGANTTPNQADIDFDGYVYSGYVEDNPGYSGNTFISFVGIYIDSNGNYSGTYIANTQVEQY